MSFAVFRKPLWTRFAAGFYCARLLSQQACWKCEKNAGSGHFCNSCNVILPLAEANFFEYIGMPKRFDVDENALKKRFRDLQFKLHPDKFAQSSSKERDLSEEHVRKLNQVYKTLSEPLARANYLLKLEGLSKKGDLNQEALMELMERNERIASFTEENDLKAELEKVNRDIEDEMDAMGEAFEHGNYTKVRDHITLLTYLYSVKNSVDQRLQLFFKV